MIEWTDLNIVDPVVCSHNINPVVGTNVRSSNCQVIGFQVDSKVEDNVKFGTVHEDKIMD